MEHCTDFRSVERWGGAGVRGSEREREGVRGRERGDEGSNGGGKRVSCQQLKKVLCGSSCPYV